MRPAARQVVAAAVLLVFSAAASALDIDVEQFGCHANAPAKDTGRCTQGFAAAVAKASGAAGGGTIHARGPGAYVTAGIEMRSNVVLVVHAGASINASHVRRDDALHEAATRVARPHARGLLAAPRPCAPLALAYRQLASQSWGLAHVFLHHKVF